MGISALEENPITEIWGKADLKHSYLLKGKINESSTFNMLGIRDNLTSYLNFYGIKYSTESLNIAFSPISQKYLNPALLYQVGLLL